jgi:hypothetical protein
MTPVGHAWVDRVERWRQSGVDAEAFAASEGEPVTATRLKRWKWKLSHLARKRDRGDAVAMKFVRLEATKVDAGPVEIVVSNGRLVRVGVGFDEGTLSRVLKLLEGAAR